MIFTITMKNPDVLDFTIKNMIDEIFTEEAFNNLKNEEEIEEIKEEKFDEIKEVCRKWFEYDEYIHLQIDTDLQTCKVLSVNQ